MCSTCRALTPPPSVAYPPSLPPALFSAAMAPVHYALSETEQYEGGLTGLESSPPRPSCCTIPVSLNGFL